MGLLAGVWCPSLLALMARVLSVINVEALWGASAVATAAAAAAMLLLIFFYTTQKTMTCRHGRINNPGWNSNTRDAGIVGVRPCQTDILLRRRGLLPAVLCMTSGFRCRSSKQWNRKSNHSSLFPPQQKCIFARSPRRLFRCYAAQHRHPPDADRPGPGSKILGLLGASWFGAFKLKA